MGAGAIALVAWVTGAVPPVGVAIAVGIGVGVAWNWVGDYGVERGISWIYVSLGGTDPFQQIRNLRPLGSN